MTMPHTANSRKSRFRAALALAGMSAEEWAKGQGITAGHLSQVLSGKRESRSLVAKIDTFIRRFLKGAVAA